MKRFFCPLLAFLLAGALWGCSLSQTPATTTDNTEPSATATAADVDFSQADEDMFTARDKEIGYDENSCITITLNGSSATASDSSVTIEGSTVTITKDATYLIRGTLENGMLVVAAPDTAKMQLVFDGVDITNTTGAALYIMQADKVFLTLAKGAENSLTNDSVRIANGALTIAAGKDGIHTENTDDTSLGFFYASGGSISIEAEGDGISSSSYIQVEGGSFDILAGGGYENGTQTSSGNYGGFGGSFGGGFGGGFGGMGGGGMRPRSADTSSVSTDASTSMKGIKAGSSILLSGGAFTLDTADDSIHADVSLTVNGGAYEIASGDDGVHAETDLVITNCEMNISQCYEGLEAQTITVVGGDITINASDDGLNASGGADASGLTGGRDGMFGGKGGMGGGMMGGADENAFISVAGGKLTIYAGGDGLDSNGNLTVSGGYTQVYNPKSGDTSVLDSQNAPVITGGVYIGMGITTNMAETFSSSSTQGVIACSVGSVPSGVEITITDTSGSQILSCATQYNTALLIISTPDIVKGQTYTVTAGELSGDLQAS